MQESIEEFDLLSPLSNGNSHRAIGGSGALLTMESGETTVDLNEMRVVLGQQNVAFNQAMANALGGFTAPKDGYSKEKQRLLQYLDDATKGRFSSAFLTSSGSEAVEWAVRLARKLTGKAEVFSFFESIHGRTYLAASMSGLPKRKVGYGPLAPGIVLLPYPNCARKPQSMSAEELGDACLQQANDIYRYGSSQSGAALVVELCKGFGAVRPPKGYLPKLQQWAKENGMLFIVDEIQTGMGRTGSMFLYEQEGLDPDMLLLGKALGNGLHIAALLVKDAPAKDDLVALSGGSGDDPLACAAACEVFRQLEGGLLSHVKSAGDALCEGLNNLSHYNCVRECRGVGLMAAVEFISADVCARVAAKVQAAGYLPGCTGNVLFCKPPYVITLEQVQGFIKALSDALEQEN